MSEKNYILGEGGSVIINTETSSTCIPPDPANADYQAYLEWVAEGNQPTTVEP